MEFSYAFILVVLILSSQTSSSTFKSVGDPCVDSKLGQNGTCELLKLCTTAQLAIRQNKFPVTCGFTTTDSHPIVCCLKEKRLDSIQTSPVPNRNRNNVSSEKCLEYSEKTKDLLSRTDAIVTNIVNGKNATLGEYPHMAALGYDGDEQIEWSCGGTLISERFVLTAAHCLRHGAYGPVKYVKLGVVDLLENPLENVHNVKNATSHPDYTPPRTYHDIALLELEQEVEFTENIKPACLYTSPDLSMYKTNSLHVSGYGLTSYGGFASNLLQYVILDLFTREECDRQYPKTRRLPNGIDYDIQLCAGKRYVIQDACQGDSGGPIQVQDYKKRLYNIVGVTSFGKGCGAKGVPGVYAKITQYVKWIENIVWP